MTRVSRLIAISIITVIVIPIGGMRFFNTEILQAAVPSAIRTIVTLYFAPNDLYTPLVRKTIQNDSTETKFVVNVHPIYYGLHHFVIVIPKFSNEQYFLPKADQALLTASVDCKFSSGRKWAAHGLVGSQFIGHEDGGFGFGTFSVPQDVPLDETSICEFWVDDKARDFLRKFGAVEIRVEKLSDL